MNKTIEAIFEADFDEIKECDFCGAKNVKLYIEKNGEPYCWCKTCAINSIKDIEGIEGEERRKD